MPLEIAFSLVRRLMVNSLGIAYGHAEERDVLSYRNWVKYNRNSANAIRL